MLARTLTIFLLAATSAAGSSPAAEVCASAADYAQLVMNVRQSDVPKATAFSLTDGHPPNHVRIIAMMVQEAYLYPVEPELENKIKAARLYRDVVEARCLSEKETQYGWNNQ